jgi:hypothetical protein
MPELWPFRPVPSSTEALAWETEVLKTPTSERRISIRAARQSISYSYLLRDKENAEAEWLVRAYPLGEWWVPLWFEASPAAAYTSAQTVLAVNTDAHYFAGDSLVIWESCDQATVCEIASVASGAVTLTAPIGRNYPKAVVMPVRTAWMDGGLRQSRIRERGITDVAVTFQVKDNGPAGESPWPQYLSLDLVTKCGTVEALAAAVAPVFTTVDNGSGPVALEPKDEFIASRHTMSWRLQSNLWQRRKWLHFIRGRDRAFWLADWQKDFTLVNPITAAGTTITVRKIAPVAADLIGRHILIDDGTKTPRQITNAVTSGSNQVLTIAAVGRDIASAKISLLRKVRFDSDVLELAHQHGFYTAVRIPLVEVPE